MPLPCCRRFGRLGLAMMSAFTSLVLWSPGIRKPWEAGVQATFFLLWCPGAREEWFQLQGEWELGSSRPQAPQQQPCTGTPEIAGPWTWQPAVMWSESQQAFGGCFLHGLLICHVRRSSPCDGPLPSQWSDSQVPGGQSALTLWKQSPFISAEHIHLY